MFLEMMMIIKVIIIIIINYYYYYYYYHIFNSGSSQWSVFDLSKSDWARGCNSAWYKPTWMVANTLHISNKAKATAKTAPMTLTITAMAFISDGQSTMEMQRKHF